MEKGADVDSGNVSSKRVEGRNTIKCRRYGTRRTGKGSKNSGCSMPPSTKGTGNVSGVDLNVLQSGSHTPRDEESEI
jgi:hypothetical protein